MWFFCLLLESPMFAMSSALLSAGRNEVYEHRYHRMKLHALSATSLSIWIFAISAKCNIAPATWGISRHQGPAHANYLVVSPIWGMLTSTLFILRLCHHSYFHSFHRFLPRLNRFLCSSLTFPFPHPFRPSSTLHKAPSRLLSPPYPSPHSSPS